jgi:hypothetical protein
LELFPVGEFPYPTTFPPVVDVVRNHASMLKTFGPGAGVRVEARPSPLPSKPAAVSASPAIAPEIPRVTPVPTARSAVPTRSYTGPEGSPKRQ